jgi:hypothetical protein
MENSKDVCIGLWVALGGALLAGLLAASLLLIFGHSNNWNLALILAFEFEACAFAAGFRERKTKLGKAGIIVSLAIIALTLVLAAKLIPMFFLMIISAMGSMGVFSGIWASKFANGRLMSWKIFVFLWIISVICYLPFVMILNHDYYSYLPYFVNSIVVLCGPWAGVVAREWPNPGELYSAPLAIVMSVLLIVLAAILIKSQNSRIRALAMVLYGAFVFVWTTIGFVQLFVRAT